MGPTGVVGQDFYAPFSTGRPAQVRGGPGHGRWAESNWARQAWLARAPVRSSWSAGAVSVREWTLRSLCIFQLGIWKLIILSPFDLHDNSRRFPQHPRHYVPWERRERGGRRKETKRERKKKLGKSRLRSLQHEVTEIPDILWNRSLSCKNRR